MPCVLPKPPHLSCWRGLISPNDLRMMTVRTKGILERPPAVPSVEGAGPSPGHRRRLRAGLWWLGGGFPVLPAWGGAWGPPRLLPIKQSWHFRARQRRWLPALEASIWPSSQHRLPGPSPLTSADPDRGPQPATVILPAPQWGHSGAQQCPLPLRGALGCSLCLCGWGASGCGASSWQPGATLLKTGLLTEGTEVPHTSRVPGAPCSHCPRPRQGQRGFRGAGT